MDEYRIDLKVRNNIILQKIERAGYSSIGEFCRINKLMNQCSVLGKVINMRISPLQVDGEFRRIVKKAAEILGCDPIDFFTDTQMHTVLKSNKRSIAVNEAEMKFMLEQKNNGKFLDDFIHEEQKNKAVHDALESLMPRERMVIEMRLGIGNYSEEHTLDDIAKSFDITRERIRQIEGKALRKLRHPSKIDKLRDFID